MVVAFYFRLHLAYFPRPVVAIFARPEQQLQIGATFLPPYYTSNFLKSKHSFLWKFVIVTAQQILDHLSGIEI